ncbi:MAG: hypothetical protein J1E95_09455 [Muribaculaceae bacterium]|nr:hypothetical protein [Muribaculaceae bacterium]
MNPKIYMAAFLALAGAAQPIICHSEEAAPNRLLVVDKAGNLYGGFVTDYIEDVRFATIEGAVEAKVEILDVEIERVKIHIYKTPACESFRFSVIPSTIAMAIDDLGLISYVESYGTEQYYQDFEEDLYITGIHLDHNTSYCVVTVGYDTYDIAAGVYRVEFTTPAAEIVGKPYVNTTIENLTGTSFTIKFTPNADVSEYYPVAFVGGEGAALRDFQMYGGMMGYANVNEMLVGFTWDNPCVGTVTKTWDGMDPGTEHEVAIAVKDLDGNFTENYQSVVLKTVSNGGSGPAYVDIEFGDFSFSDWDGELLGTQEVYFWPNENTSRYRWAGYEADDYRKYSKEINAELCSEPPYNISGWFLYEDYYDELQLDADVEYAILAAGQNDNKEWGEINVSYYRTPDIDLPDYKAKGISLKKALPNKDGKVAARIATQKYNTFKEAQKGAKAPVGGQPRKMQLSY